LLNAYLSHDPENSLPPYLLRDAEFIIVFSIVSIMDFIEGLEIVPEKCVICIEEDAGNTKSLFASLVSSERGKKGIAVNYLTLRNREEIHQQIEQLHLKVPEKLRVITISPQNSAQDVISLIYEPEIPLIVIDAFSVFFSEYSFTDLYTLMFRMISASHNGTTFLLLIDRGVLPERHENLVRAMADGVIEFTIVPEGDKLRHYINIPKMRGEFPRDKMLPFTVNEEGLLIDTRERHG
jgi:KaiC/GvpD/RAD55 family RecA-like ATPase